MNASGDGLVYALFMRKCDHFLSGRYIQVMPTHLACLLSTKVKALVGHRGHFLNKWGVK